MNIKDLEKPNRELIELLNQYHIESLNDEIYDLICQKLPQLTKTEFLISPSLFETNGYPRTWIDYFHTQLIPTNSHSMARALKKLFRQPHADALIREWFHQLEMTVIFSPEIAEYVLMGSVEMYTEFRDFSDKKDKELQERIDVFFNMYILPNLACFSEDPRDVPCYDVSEIIFQWEHFDSLTGFKAPTQISEISLQI